MQGKPLFLRWALFVSLIAIGGCIAAALGWMKMLFGGDPTHITYVTFGVFLLAVRWCGVLAWRLSNGAAPATIIVDVAHSRFASTLCVSIGLIGTALGYFIMLKNGNAGGEPGEIIKEAFANTSIAIINTIFGAVCGVLVEIQCHFIEHAATVAEKKLENLR